MLSLVSAGRSASSPVCLAGGRVCRWPARGTKNDVLRILGLGVGVPILIYAIGVLAVLVILIRELRKGDDE